ncbi:MAG: hypothetical protein G01um101418_866 [Parcubacteria group bacterium Gr01-1014_18]|nr:MAG: hypothetical protein Greene041636_826 [Parcubacteria group bacterium Greene0416_36]TSC79867.1 MAG: hypothetical protein G01um101418_866 [Parcubacteria group bacterium Gr01-1014_18]TSC98299.1 MAG: hypothetical protein Greene101420_803 [Parcubacteria group bacterium Greene1014_20]TSD06660.1 MAG: hypothetical protein Greene07142_712 [Parcubacteria group bacterium Greene0714_2]
MFVLIFACALLVSGCATKRMAPAGLERADYAQRHCSNQLYPINVVVEDKSLDLILKGSILDLAQSVIIKNDTGDIIAYHEIHDGDLARVTGVATVRIKAEDLYEEKPTNIYIFNHSYTGGTDDGLVYWKYNMKGEQIIE